MSEADNHNDDLFEDYEPPSKSELKRRQLAVQDLIAELVSLPNNQIDALPADTGCLDEIRVAAGMTPSSARNRQIRYIAKLVSKDQDVLENIKLLLETTEQAKRKSANELHRCEYWREIILSGSDDDIFEFSTAFHAADQQQLRQLRRDYLKFSRTENLSSRQLKSAETKRKEISRKVFKLIADSIQNSSEQLTD